jgi:2',3'-cyclic-nucleotide 2'-phosphodiesterase
MAKILIIGDIMGRPGRHAASQVLPIWKEEHKLDVIIGNVENLAHGRGITLNTIKELKDLGFDAFTSGNHVFSSGPHAQECFDKYPEIVRPANYDSGLPGPGYYRFAKNGQQFLVINLSGKLFMDPLGKFNALNPFFTFDQLVREQAQKDDIIIVDVHAEATGEKVALGWHADGRATIVYGTHTHVPTADERMLHKGTAYLTDVGVTGAYDSVLGITIESALGLFLEKHKMKNDIPESGPAIVNALLVETEGGKAVKIERLQAKIDI